MFSGIEQSTSFCPFCLFLYSFLLTAPQGGGAWPPLCSPLGKCPFPQHSLKKSMFHIKNYISYILKRALLGVGNLGGEPTPPTLLLPFSLDHG